MRKLMDSLDMTGNEIINVSMQKITSFPTDNLFTGRLIYLESDSEETPSGYYYYNGEEWVSIGGEGGGSTPIIDDTKINVMCDGDPNLYTFDTLADTKTFLNSNTLLKHVIIGSNANITSIDSDAFSGCTSLKSITIPSNVTSIGNNTFSDCTSLTSINIPSSVTSIGYNAFSMCTSLTSINIPSSVTSIGYNAFSMCTSLTSITIPNKVTTINSNTFYCCYSLISINIPSSVTSIGYGAFQYCKSLTSINIPSNVTSIGDNAFQGCTSLTSITIPNKVTTINGNTFQDCISLISINIPSSVTSIGVYAFINCTSLTSINMFNVTSINVYAFQNCTSLTSINMYRVSSIGYSAFYGCTSLTSVTIPSVTSIGNYAFEGCTSLTSVSIPGRFINTNLFNIIPGTIEYLTVTSGSSSGNTSFPAIFKNNPYIKNIVINSGSGITSIDNSAFNGCTSLTSISISSVTSIGTGAFTGCTSLTSISISSVTSIGTGAFTGCTSLKSITIPNTVTSIGNAAFQNCISLKSVTINANTTNIKSGTFNNCTALEDISIGSYITTIESEAFVNCTSLTSVTIPNSVTTIGSMAFQYCASLKYITINNTSKINIAGTAFVSLNSLNSVTIKGNATLGSHVFAGCSNLKTVYINEVTEIGNGMFSGCVNLSYISMKKATTIYDGAFSGCSSLKSITIPNTVTSIDSTAFVGCDIMALEPYKTRSGYPWGATSIYIQNEDVTTTIDENSTDREVPTAKTVYEALSSSGGSSLDDTKINVMCEGDPELYTFTTIDDTITFINSIKALKHVIIGENASVTNIGMLAFNHCTSLKSITIPSSVTSIGIGAFNDCTALTSINIPSSITSINRSTFYGCTSLKSITIPDSVTSINESVFSNCISLTSITIPSSVTSIGDAFNGCTSLKSITIPDGVTTINSGTFSGCTSLTSITIPNSVTRIDNNAFKNCTSLKSITIPNGVTSIGNTAFSGCDILTLEPYKTCTGYPWGATDIYIQNEDVTTTIDENSTDRQVPTAKAIYNFISPIFGIRYGFRINKNNSDPDTRVEYLYDAVGMTPAKMTYDETTHKGTFDYGSWGNVWFIKNNRPVKLNFNGTVEAELNPNNYWETVDGQDSELETSTNCNFMSEIPIVYVKRWEDENYNYVVVCDKQYDEDYLAYANTDKDGNLKPLYAPMFKGYKDSNNILRSIAGVDPMNNTTTSNEVMYSNNINTSGSVTGWQIEDVAKHELISDLLTLISKNTDSQTVFGNGVCQTSTRVFTGYNEIVTNIKTVKSDCGQFCGYNDNVHHVNIFHIQDFWGNRWDRCLGLITSGNKYYYKMTPENGGYVYSETITDYTNNGYNIAQDYSSNDITPPASGYIKNQSTGIFGNLPNATGASDSTYYCDYHYYNSSGVRLLILGGSYGHGRPCGSRCFGVHGAPSHASVSLGASPFYV